MCVRVWACYTFSFKSASLTGRETALVGGGTAVDWAMVDERMNEF